MAIDTQTKRRSTLGCWAAIRVLPVPVIGISAADRAHLYIYSGIDITDVVASVTVAIQNFSLSLGMRI